MPTIRTEGGGSDGASINATNAATKIELDAAAYIDGKGSVEQQAAQALRMDAMNLTNDDQTTYAQVRNLVNGYDSAAAQLHMPNITIGPDANYPQEITVTGKNVPGETTKRVSVFGSGPPEALAEAVQKDVDTLYSDPSNRDASDQLRSEAAFFQKQTAGYQDAVDNDLDSIEAANPNLPSVVIYGKDAMIYQNSGQIFANKFQEPTAQNNYSNERDMIATPTQDGKMVNVQYNGSSAPP